MGRGLDKDTPGGAVSRKNSKNPYTLSDSEVNSIKIVNDAFADDKKIFQNFISEKKEPGRIRRAFSAFWREIAGQKKLPYKEINVKDFAKDMEIYTKEPGIFNISGLDEYKNSGKDKELLESLRKYLEEQKANKKFYAVFLEQMKDSEDKKNLKKEWGKKAAQFDWNFADEDETFKIDPSSWPQGGSKKDYKADPKILQGFADVLASDKQSFLEVVGEDDQLAEEKKAVWREVAANKKVPFVEISKEEAAKWLAPDGSWKEDIKQSGVFNIEIDDSFDADKLGPLVEEIYEAGPLGNKKSDLYENTIINITDRGKFKAGEQRFPQSILDRLSQLS